MEGINKKIAGIFIIIAGVAELFVGINDGAIATILAGIAFCIIGKTYLPEKNRKNDTE